MELKLFGLKSVSLSKLTGKDTTISTSLLNKGRMVGFRGTAQSCSCRGVFRSPYSGMSQNTISSIGEEEVFCHPYQVNGTNGSSLLSRDAGVLDAYDDEYNGVIVNPEGLPSDPTAFAFILRSSLSHWKQKGKKGVWLRLPITKSELVPVAVQEGFEYHHAERSYVMMTYWIPKVPCLLPSNATHQVGVGGFVINDKVESEEIFSGAVREVKEETGVDTEFVEVMAFRHAHNVAFDKSDLFFICMLRPLSTQIIVDDHEIQAAKWMPLVEFVKQPHIQEDSMFKKIIEICIAKLGKHYCGLSVHQMPSKFDGRQPSLYFNIVDDQDSNCQAS